MASSETSTTEAPLYSTQGGGYAVFSGNHAVWHSNIPDFLVAAGVRIGDRIPEDWGLAATNEAACQEMDDDLSDGSDEDDEFDW